MKKLFFIIAAFFALAVTTAQAGTFTESFYTTSGIVIDTTNLTSVELAAGGINICEPNAAGSCYFVADTSGAWTRMSQNAAFMSHMLAVVTTGPGKFLNTRSVSIYCQGSTTIVSHPVAPQLTINDGCQTWQAYRSGAN